MIRTTLPAGRGWLDAPSAASLVRMDAVRGRALRTTSTGRTRAEQEDAYRKYLAGGAYAAKPGSSPHEYGNAGDFHSDEWAWLLEHGEDHGWYRTIASEPWHRVYYQTRDNHRNNQPAGTEDDIPLNADDKAWMRLMVQQEIAGAQKALKAIARPSLTHAFLAVTTAASLRNAYIAPTGYIDLGAGAVAGIILSAIPSHPAA